MKRIISLIVFLLLCVTLFAAPVSAAAASATLTGPGTIRAGDTITLTLNINGSGIYGASGTLNYNSSQLTLVSSNQKIENGWKVEFNGNNFLAIDENLAKPIKSSTALLTVTFKVNSNLAVGTAVTASYTNLTVTDGNSDTNVATATYSKVLAAPMSTDNTLKDLTVSNATISPTFSANTTNYTAEVPFEVSKLNVSATANNSKAKVQVNSPNLTPNGTTNVTVTVTAENGSKKTYTISVKRAQDPNYVASDNNSLSGITVDGFLLSPVFSAENTKYIIWLPYETENVTIGGTAADSKASVTIEGGSELKAGQDNEIKVICTAENGTQKVYTVIAKRATAHDGSVEPTVEPTEPNNPVTTPTDPQEPSETIQNGGIQWWMLLVVGIACLGIGLAGGFVIKKK